MTTFRHKPLIAGGIAIAILIVAIALYIMRDKPVTTTPTQTQIAQNGPMAPEHIEMIKGLEERMKQNPNDGKGWTMLARSYATLGRFNESAAAYEKAANLVEKNAALLANYADVLAITNGGNLQGKPLDLIHEALKIDPNNIKALFLSGKAAYQSGDNVHAVGYFEKVLKLLPPDSPLSKQVSKNIAQIRAQMK